MSLFYSTIHSVSNSSICVERKEDSQADGCWDQAEYVIFFLGSVYWDKWAPHAGFLTRQYLFHAKACAITHALDRLIFLSIDRTCIHP